MEEFVIAELITVSRGSNFIILDFFLGLHKRLLGSKGVEERDCNCQVKTNCPVRGKCCTQSVVYRGDIKVGDDYRYYIGMTKGEFKDRYREHKNSFCNPKKKSSSTMASFVWKNGLNPTPVVR